MKIKFTKRSIAILLCGAIAFTPFTAEATNTTKIFAQPVRTGHRNVPKRVERSAPAVIRITAKNFEFTPNSISLKKGVPVVLEFVSQDRRHGFSLRAFGIRTDIKPGATARVSFTPDRAGNFSFKCDVFCGDGHEDMTGTIVVTE
jgi:cytochrome c oxidase subunit 2